MQATKASERCFELATFESFCLKLPHRIDESIEEEEFSAQRRKSFSPSDLLLAISMFDVDLVLKTFDPLLKLSINLLALDFLLGSFPCSDCEGEKLEEVDVSSLKDIFSKSIMVSHDGLKEAFQEDSSMRYFLCRVIAVPIKKLNHTPYQHAQVGFVGSVNCQKSFKVNELLTFAYN
mmetsp:Transcript_4231/g.5501  ORF Transcript_4231/g.5501 Transcript_4231/m.5501 type:complete len:177 (+) Transcript_4231:487-1017(+)